MGKSLSLNPEEQNIFSFHIKPLEKEDSLILLFKTSFDQKVVLLLLLLLLLLLIRRFESFKDISQRETHEKKKKAFVY